MAEENFEEQHFGDVQNIGEQHLSDTQVIEEQHFGDMQNIEEQHFGDIQNIDEQHFGDIPNIEGQHFGDMQNINEHHLDDTQIIGEPHLDDALFVEEQHLNDTQILEEQHLDGTQNIEEKYVGDLPNIEEQHSGDIHEMDNVPGDAEEEKESENNPAVAEEQKWPGWPGENVFRVLVPVQKVGGIIGRKGEFIKKMCEETKSRIKILDGPPGITERAILISAKEEPNLLIPPAMDGLLQIHKRIVELDCDPANAASGVTVCIRLLVAASQAGSLIGKQGATVKSIQDDSHCIIRVIGGDNLPVFALPDDSVVEVQGDPANTQKGVELVASHLRKFLVDRSVINVFEVQMQAPNARGNQGMQPPQSWRHPSPSFPMSPPGAAGHGYDPFMAPPQQRPYDNYYPPVDMSFEKPFRSGPSAYGRGMSGGGAHTPNVQQPQQAVIAKVTHNLQIQLSFADAVIGVKGANISYIRRASGATIAIQEAQGVPDQMNVEINGSASQVQAAEQLIKNSIADAKSSMQQNATGGGAPPSQQGYNLYAPPHGVYDASTGGGHAQPPPTDYGSMYGAPANYGGY